MPTDRLAALIDLVLSADLPPGWDESTAPLALGWLLAAVPELGD